MPAPRILLAAFLACVGLLAVWAALDPDVLLLIEPRGSSGARWIRAPSAFDPRIRAGSVERSFFRTKVRLPDPGGPAARARLLAFRSAVVSLDGRVLNASDPTGRSWKDALAYELSPDTARPVHELLVVAESRNAHPAILLECPPLGLRTDETWETSTDGAAWSPAAAASTPVELPIWEAGDTVAAAFVRALPWQAAIALAVLVVARARRSSAMLARASGPSGLRWVLLVAWTILAANNVGRIPAGHGFDAPQHVDYVLDVLDGKLPLANEGWQTFQPPFFYVVSAALVPFIRGLDVPLEIGLRCLPLACGLVQIEVVYRIARAVFPADAGLQSIALVLGSFLPMNVTMAQAVGNEPLFGVLSAGVLLRCATMLRAPPASASSAVGLGALVGLAMLTKATGWLLLPIAGIAVVASAGRAGAGGILGRLATTAAVAVALAGWFYARNWVALGKPVIGGWDEETGIVWWQDPGCRTPGDLLRFGSCLRTPILASVRGFWDGLYSSLWADGGLSGVIGYPAWNYAFVFAAMWLALPLSAAIVAGAFVRPSPGAARMRDLSVLAVLAFLLAMLWLFLRVPTYSTVKASYTLGITPCYGILAAVGARPLLATALGRALVAILLTVFAAFTFLAYFVAS